MTHEVYAAAAARRRALPDRDGSQYDTLRLVVQRSGTSRAMCSLILERIGQQRVAGSRLAFATIPTTDPNGRSYSLESMLEMALVELRRSRP